MAEQNKNCLFCKIIAGEIPSEKIYEDEKCIVIPDKFPTALGQSLVVAKKHIPYVFDLNTDDYLHLFRIAKDVALALDKTFNPERVCLLVEGFQVDHIHIKLYPVKEKKLILEGTEPANDQELKVLAKKISLNLK